MANCSNKLFSIGVPNGDRDILVGDLPELLSTMPTTALGPDDRDDLDWLEVESVPHGTDPRAY